MFKMTRYTSETWRECVERYASKQLLKDECLAEYDKLIEKGRSEMDAAWKALYEWDCLDYVRK